MPTPKKAKKVDDNLYRGFKVVGVLIIGGGLLNALHAAWLSKKRPIRTVAKIAALILALVGVITL